MADRNSMIDILETGLRASSLRGKVVAGNLANVDTPGFRRRAVAFEKRLAEALSSARPGDLSGLEPEIVEPGDTLVQANGNDVSIDMEVGEMVKNSARYKTYMRVMAKVYQQMEAAMQTG